MTTVLILSEVRSVSEDHYWHSYNTIQNYWYKDADRMHSFIAKLSMRT